MTSDDLFVQSNGLSARDLRRMLLGTLVVGFVILAAVSIASGWLVARDLDYTKWVNHTFVVEGRIARFNVLFERAEAARRGYLLTREPAYLGNYRQVATELPQRLESVLAITGDNPRQQRSVAELMTLLAHKLDDGENSVRVAQTSSALTMAADPGSIARLVDAGQHDVERIRLVLGRMTAEEEGLLAERTARQSVNAEGLLTLVLTSGVLLSLLGLVALVLVRRYSADLDRSREALMALNESLEQRVRDRTADLSRANEEIQRFAYIVSHDLRSPLVNVMGFTSELEVAAASLRKMIDDVDRHEPRLVSPEARTAIEMDLPESIGFIRSSTQKMDRLITAILKLSREGRRTFAAEQIDMSALLQGVAASLRHVAAERRAEIVVEPPVPDIIGDRLAMEQIFSNLVENALKYLEPGQPGEVRVRGRIEGARVIYEVQDNGRGIDAKDHERIFDLFRRAGRQDQPGEGIGLAHVRALAYRLGGAVEVDSALDRGATFRVSLPRPSRAVEETAS